MLVAIDLFHFRAARSLDEANGCRRGNLLARWSLE
jgi:hypothetical protein